MSKKIKLVHNDVLIRRVKNGWVAIIKNDEIDSNETFVYSDKEMPLWVSESLYQLLIDNFEPYLQSKREGGIVLNFKHKGREE